MRKVWIYKRKGVKGWWAGWYESGKRKAKALPTRKLSEHFCQLKYSQLNSDVFTGIVLASWEQMLEEYRHSKRVAGVTEAVIYETSLTFRHFERIVGKCSSKQITQNAVDKFILLRGEEVKRPTLNKDIRNLKTFVKWCVEHRCIGQEIKLRQLKEDERPVKSLNSTQIKKLLSAAKSSPPMKIRIMLALGTGLRRGDIESLKISDIDFESNSITTASKKTRKSMGSRPVSAELMTELLKYVCGLYVGQEKLFSDSFNHYKWRKLCNAAEIADLKFHDLRKTLVSSQSLWKEKLCRDEKIFLFCGSVFDFFSFCRKPRFIGWKQENESCWILQVE